MRTVRRSPPRVLVGIPVPSLSHHLPRPARELREENNTVCSATGAMAADIIPPPGQIPKITQADDILPILIRLLQCPRSLLLELSTQVLGSLDELPVEDKPTSYEGLLDVARFCVEDDPGWTNEQRAGLIAGRQRAGHGQGSLLTTSASTQPAGGLQAAQADSERLSTLNFLYEQRFPSLRFVPRREGAAADELTKLLGPNIVGLPPPGAKLDPEDPSQSWSGFPLDSIRQKGSSEWVEELHRAEAVVWELAADRAEELTKLAESGPVTLSSSEQEERTLGSSSAAQPSLTVTPEATESADEATPSSSAFDVPFLSQATFRALILASPILHTFFEQDLPASFLLRPVERHTSTKEAFLSALNDATGQGAGKAVTRERVKGLLGGLLGEVADVVGNRLQQQTVIGPKPSFDRAGKKGRGLSLEEAARTQGSKLAPVSPAALSHKSSAAALRQREESRKERDAAESVRLAQEALLSQRDSSQQFVIDAPGDETGDAGEEPEEEVEDLVMGEGLTVGVGEEGRLTGREAELAKDLRTAEVQ
ncbi:unnamed protein product [Parajaminaea phylloscopi]